MASRVSAQDLIKFCDQNPDCGIWYTIAETTSQFTFADSESTKCNQKLVVCLYDREYAVQSTEFDIVEQGHVPILMSLTQMRNLRFQFELHPDNALLSSPVLGIANAANVKLKVAPSLAHISCLIFLNSVVLSGTFASTDTRSRASSPTSRITSMGFIKRPWEALHKKMMNPRTSSSRLMMSG